MTMLFISFSMFNLFLLILFIHYKSRHQLHPTEHQYARDIHKNQKLILFLVPLSLSIIERLLIWLKRRPWASIYILLLQRKVAAVYGQQDVEAKLKHWLAQLLIIQLLILEFGFVFALLAQDSLFMLFDLVLIILYSSIYYRQLEQQKKIRERLILRELPEWMSKMVLLVQAGETIQQAFIRTLSGHEQDQHPLYRELRITIQQLRNRVPFAEAIEQLSQRCQLQEMRKLTTTLMLYQQRGASDFSLTLKGLVDELWEKRKALVKQQGEEAAAKLVFPLVIIFIGILIIIAWPALQMLAY